MSANFRAIYKTSHGDTVESDNPKLEAYKQARYLHVCGYNYGIIIHEDGCYTVQAETISQHRIADITYQRRCLSLVNFPSETE